MDGFNHGFIKIVNTILNPWVQLDANVTKTAFSAQKPYFRAPRNFCRLKLRNVIKA